MIRFIFTTIFAASCLFSIVAAQSAAKPLATARGVAITADDISPEARELHENLAKRIAQSRTRIFSAFLAEQLLETEAAARKLTVAELQQEARKAVPEPPGELVQTVYDQNRAALGNAPLAEVRSQIVEFLRREPEQKALQAQVAALQTKLGLKFGKDINAADLRPLDTVAAFGTRTITAKEFEEKNRIELYDSKAHFFDDLRFAVESALRGKLIAEEARSLNIAPNELVAREITNKMRDYTDEEYLELEYALERRLFEKYGARILLDEPPPLVLDVSADDDPSFGPSNAAVTIVMFSDFQCPACARAHPVLKRAIADFGDKVRFVVRDFPLESIHPDALNAALAANAARTQGKYFEYIDVLYRNQGSLDTDSLKKYASDLGLNVKRLEEEMAAASNEAEIRKDVDAGVMLGVAGTPTIYVNGVKVHRLSGPAFRKAIERALGK